MATKGNITKKQLSSFEKRSGVVLPSAYRAFASRQLGGYPVRPVGQSDDGRRYHVSKVYHLDDADMRGDMELFPRCTDDGLLPLALRRARP